MALTYPIFIRIGEFLRKLSRSPDSAKRSPTELATLLHTLVEANGLQIAAIGTSCLSVISSMPNIKSEALDENRVAVEAQMVLAKNSIAWAMKAISPLLLLFYIKVNMSVQETPEMRGPRPKPKPVSNDKPEDAIVIPIIPTARGDDQSMDEIQQEIAATPNTPYQNALHDNYALKYYQKPAEPQNFVYYFYAKEGQELSALLTDMRTKYENYVHSAMDNIKQPVKDKVSEFVTKYHDARKPTVPSDDMGVSDINFRDDISKIFSGLDMKLRDNLATLTRYFEFTKNMESHWNYRIKKNMELDQDAVLEVSIEMMGTTVALTYPIFIKIAEYIVDIMKTNKVTTGQLSPNSLVERFKKFSFLLTTEMAAIGMSCTTLMAQIPKATRESVSTRTIRLANETKIADGAISWAMKAVFPIMMIYFLQYESA
ncbi:uncharacterized protein LOC118437772 [Folsomia candida]|nr:uncharacterized protein LOC118437772 [Folsomia candida]